MSRREFSVALQVAIVNRASDSSWRIHCEKCGRWCPKRRDYEIDHIIPEAMRPLADLARKLTAADGQLLCVAVCHPEKTKQDQAELGLAKRREAYDLGIEPPGKKKIRQRRRKERPPYRPAGGQTQIARRYP